MPRSRLVLYYPVCTDGFSSVRQALSAFVNKGMNAVICFEDSHESHKSLVVWCGGLNRSGLYGLICFSAWSVGSGATGPMSLSSC